MNDHTEIENRMRFLIASLKDELSDKEVNEVLQYIDAGEYGVALEDLYYIYNEKLGQSNEAILNEMNSLAKIMVIEL